MNYPIDAKFAILKRLDAICRERKLDDFGGIQWNDWQVARSSAIRTERGDPAGWYDFLEHLRNNPEVAWGFRGIFEEMEIGSWTLFVKYQELTPYPGNSKWEIPAKRTAELIGLGSSWFSNRLGECSKHRN